MKKTKAEVMSWLRSDNQQRVILVEIEEVLVGTTPTSFFLSDRAYVAETTNISYDNCISNGVTFTESLDIQNGSASLGYGDIELDNTNGVRDSWVNYVWKNRTVKILIGDASWSRDDFYQIFLGRVSTIAQSNRNSLNIILVDATQQLNTPINLNSLPDNTNAAAENQVIPLLYGECFNVTPLLVDPVQKIYQVHDGSIVNILEVRDNGYPVEFTEDLENGKFTLLRNPVGVITASVQGGGTPSVIINPGFVPDYVVIEYGFDTGQDLDTRTKIVVPELGSYLGWSQGSSYDVNGSIILSWAGDNLGTGTEAVLFNTINYKANYSSTPDVQLDCRVQWYNQVGTTPVVLKLKFYRGGVMDGPANFNYTNPTAIETYSADIFTQVVTFFSQSGASIGEQIALFNINVNTGLVSLILGDETVTANFDSKISSSIRTILTDVTTIVNSIPVTQDEMIVEEIEPVFNSNDVGIYIDSRQNKLDVLQQLANSIGGFVIPTFNNTLRLLQLRADITDSPDYTIGYSDIIEKQISLSKQAVFGAVKVGYCKNWTVQRGNLAVGIPPEHIELFGSEYLYVKAENTTVLTQYGQKSEPVAKNTLLIKTDQAQAEANRLLSIWSVPRYIYTVECLPHLLMVELGDVVKLYNSRFGLETGKTGMVIGINRNWLSGKVSLSVFV